MKVLIYCTKAKNKSDYLTRYYAYDFAANRHVRSCVLTGMLELGSGTKELNGKICFMADLVRIIKPDFPMPGGMVNFSDACLLSYEGIKLGVMMPELTEYLGDLSKPAYLFVLGNIEECFLDLNDFYSDPECTRPLTRAPQSYQIVYFSPSDENTEGFLLFSDRPKFVQRIQWGQKECEIRKTIPGELKLNAVR